MRTDSYIPPVKSTKPYEAKSYENNSDKNINIEKCLCPKAWTALVNITHALSVAN